MIIVLVQKAALIAIFTYGNDLYKNCSDRLYHNHCILNYSALSLKLANIEDDF